MDRLPPVNVNNHPVLAFVFLEPHVGLPLRFEVALLGGNAFLRPEQGIAPEVFVAFLGETESGFVPDQSIRL